MTDSIVVDEQEEIEQQQAVEAEDKPEEAPKLPDKFKNKSPTEIVEMYQHLESDYGRRANEIGHLRKLTDELLGFSRTAIERKQPVEREPQKKITADEILASPDETVTAIAKRVADERSSASEQRLASLELSLLEERFEKRHPGFKSKMSDDGFLQWVGASPYRQRLAYQAAQNNFDAADELFSLHEEYEKLSTQPDPGETPRAQAKAAGLAKSGGSSAAGVQPKTAGNGKKVYSRQELIRMRIENPDEYDARFQTEFYQAYQEGRVR